MDEHNHDRSVSRLPQWIISPYQSFIHRLNNETRVLHLSVRGLTQLTLLPDIIALLAHIEESEDYPERLQAAQADSEWVRAEIENGFPILHSHSTIALWNILQVSSEDLAVAWLQNVQEAWEIDEIQRIKVPLATYEALDDIERVRFIVQELVRDRGSGRRTGASALDSVLTLFDLRPAIGDNLRRALHELHQVRNALVHYAGLADRKLTLECPWLHLAQGDSIYVSHEIWSWYRLAAERYAERMLNSVVLHFGEKGCTCPGMHDVPDRPVDLRNNVSKHEEVDSRGESQAGS